MEFEQAIIKIKLEALQKEYDYWNKIIEEINLHIGSKVIKNERIGRYIKELSEDIDKYLKQLK